ncbi:MAG: hypothetical protein HOO96_14705 [Polyangiaceae bacterium]|nr:hypothetical protein [Polyangiaceae bacterium]
MAVLFFLGAVAVLACHNKQTIYTCRACLRDDPSRCKTYEGFCYGPNSHAMSASSTNDAKDLAIRLVCSQWFEPVPPSGLQPQCKVGLGFSPAAIAEAYSYYDFTCSSRVEKCP